MRRMICADMEGLGIIFDNEKNHGSRGCDIVLSKPESKVIVMAVTTDEEFVIASDTRHIIEQKGV
jgi:acetate kinase